MDFEQLSYYLQQAINDKERIEHPERFIHDSGSFNISEMILDKIKEVRGVDMELDRREKLVRLGLRIKELQEEVAKSSDISQDFSEQVIKEYAYFQDVKGSEIKSGLNAYADSHIEFYEKVIFFTKKERKGSMNSNNLFIFVSFKLLFRVYPFGKIFYLY